MSRSHAEYFGIVRIVIAVLLVMLLVDAAHILAGVGESNTLPAAAVLLLVLIFVFAEVYVVLAELHQDLELPYAQPWLYLDLLVGLVVLWLAAELRGSAECELGDDATCNSDLGPAMRIGIVVFLAFLTRLVIGFVLVDEAKKTGEIKRRYYLRIAANLGGVCLTSVVLLAEPDGFLRLTVFDWSVVGAGVTLLYFVMRAVPFKIQIAARR